MEIRINKERKTPLITKQSGRPWPIEEFPPVKIAEMEKDIMADGGRGYAILIDAVGANVEQQEGIWMKLLTQNGVCQVWTAKKSFMNAITQGVRSELADGYMVPLAFDLENQPVNKSSKNTFIAWDVYECKIDDIPWMQKSELTDSVG